MSRALQSKLQERAEREAKIQGLLQTPGPPEILSAALAALNGSPHPRDPWSFNSVLENQAGSLQAERFISIIRRTRRSNIVENRDMVKAVWELCGIPWFKTLDSWSGRGKTAQARFRSLAAHLTCKYPMPEFLFTVFLIPEVGNPQRYVAPARAPQRNRPQMLALYQHLVSGGSVKVAVAQGLLPVPLTNKMCHEFMQGPRSGDVYTAIRYAQTRGSVGGSENLARALAATRLGRGLYAEDMEPRILTVIEWFCRQGMLNTDLIGPLFDYIEHRLHDLEFNITGRTVTAMQRGMEEWHQAMNRAGQHGVPNSYGGGRTPPEKFKSSGIAEPELIEIQNVLWSVQEILTMADLITEGSQLKHCVSSYWYRIEGGSTSIWTLQRENRRELTLEVDNLTRTVVQARGVCNARPTSDQARMMHHWASKNHIRISSFL
jgi:hypothetical protein